MKQSPLSSSKMVSSSQDIPGNNHSRFLPPPNPWQPQSAFCLCGRASSGHFLSTGSCMMRPLISVFFRQRYVLKVHPHRGVGHCFLPFYDCVIFHCLGWTTVCLSIHLLIGIWVVFTLAVVTSETLNMCVHVTLKWSMWGLP